MQLDTYLFYHGDCADALALYQAAFGAQIHTLVRFRDTPDAANVPPEWHDKVMHGVFSVGPNAIMVSDGQFGQPRREYSGFTLSIAADDAASGERVFTTLSDGGDILTPWQSTFFTQGFGMVKDRFGVPWLINVVHPEEAAAA
ncbi:PhnB protein putative DNA binding 3-demethylubiquinone-9 3-methyltransferase domain protein [Candidatus Burkholderia verschuerenii]|uniref:PhnB protein putative DNA binding 3-demethylubiquinone-9 3-methyltransferase domain protein n=1 Tax=Candidatus Burkholderia verschuerenii TaxID=242163 RepID=A0A0L0MHR9_9BURK|nr:VOC family protein [Candidatus Burkholderia verschuerenii]KND61840.1 PhnB protein putative DNA binding 3-demethylubiquinone-9 3-methyltransferase domain protein [Candidatus Burkholderia verschuerenii]